MKKVLLSCALMLGAMSAMAEGYSDYFTLNVADGGKIVCKEFEANDVSALGTYTLEIPVLNATDGDAYVWGGMECIGNPSIEDLSNSSKWGNPAFCFENGGANGDEGLCLDGGGNYVGMGFIQLPPKGVERPFCWAIHIYQAPKDLKCEYRLQMSAAQKIDEDDDFYGANAEEIEGTEFSCTLLFDAEAGVATIEFDNNAPKEYYTMQGVRVFDPAPGMYIVKQGGKVRKDVVR